MKQCVAYYGCKDGLTSVIFKNSELKEGNHCYIPYCIYKSSGYVSSQVTVPYYTSDRNNYIYNQHRIFISI